MRLDIGLAAILQCLQDRSLRNTCKVCGEVIPPFVPLCISCELDDRLAANDWFLRDDAGLIRGFSSPSFDNDGVATE